MSGAEDGQDASYTRANLQSTGRAETDPFTRETEQEQQGGGWMDRIGLYCTGRETVRV